VKLAGRPLGLAKEDRRYENLMAFLEEGVDSLDDQVAYGPTLVVQEKVGDLPDLAIARADFVSFNVF
jgi:hypothetical protein